MVGYVEARECRETVMRNIHVDNARSAHYYLEKHHDFMTARQKEIFDKLNNVTY